MSTMVNLLCYQDVIIDSVRMLACHERYVYLFQLSGQTLKLI